MANEPIITNERVDDIPVLLTQMERMGVQRLMDKNFPTHGNWQGQSLGNVVVIWLAHILSQADHRLNQVRAWASKRLDTLKTFMGESLDSLDLTDDRLEAVLRYLNCDTNWYAFEEELGSSLLQVYELKPERVRLDSTTASSHCGVNAEGLFQWGHSKDHRPDLAQVKIMLSTLDPLGMPIATEILSGEKADDPLYIPAIERVRSTLKQPGLLYIGDCKIGSMGTRTHIVDGGDFYLCPLNTKQAPPEKLREYLHSVEEGKQELTTIDYDYADGKTRDIAEGFELKLLQKVEIDNQEIFWEERQLVVRSFAIAQTEEKYLRERIQKTLLSLEQLKIPRRGKKKLTSSDEWESAVACILKRYRTSGLFQIEIQTKRVQKVKRRYLERQPQTVEEISFDLDFQINEDALRQQLQLLGWRVYVTNKTETQLTLKQAVRAYRDEYLTERGFARLQSFPLSLTPIYLQREDHVTGLIRLLSIGLRILTLLEFQVRCHLETNQEKLAGLYVGNPKRETSRPTAEILLTAFKEITLLLIEVKNEVYAHLTALSPLQQHILLLLGFPITIYTQLGGQSFTPE
ncbi:MULTISPECIES: transposase [unclassified Nostoc]|uniref:IS1634 family transposase n=1 Tax=unclassified Nostoc TaxID=2593658 RepID=UPI002AD219B6|nr:transposase [Nostoc sp. DedQUE03]MDZ7977529.1 transposase [Nostoc sp. DedQUE03]MDZ8046419.1 transposase [Nostoc sp. DedQUE02]